jgi:hypothetical protein
MEQTYILSLSGVTQADVDDLMRKLQEQTDIRVEQEAPEKVLSVELVEGITLFCTVVKDVAETVTAVGGAATASVMVVDQIRQIVRQWREEGSRKECVFAEIITPDGEQCRIEPADMVAENDTQS